MLLWETYFQSKKLPIYLAAHQRRSDAKSRLANCTLFGSAGHKGMNGASTILITCRITWCHLLITCHPQYIPISLIRCQPLPITFRHLLIRCCHMIMNFLGWWSACIPRTYNLLDVSGG